MSSVRDIEKPFKEVFETLEPKQQRKAMRTAIRTEGGRLKKAAQARIAASGLGRGTLKNISSGVRLRVFPEKYGLGFMVSVKPHGRNKGFHRNRRNLEKPVLMWAEDGTRQRRIGKSTGSFVSENPLTGKKTRRYVRGGANRGKMRRYAFLETTERQEAENVEERLFGKFQDNITTEARKRDLL